MSMEAEVPILLVCGFLLVTVIFLVGICLLYRRTCNQKALVCFLVQWACTGGAFCLMYDIMTMRPNDPRNFMRSENNSLSIALAGICWAVSIIFMLIGVYSLTSKKHNLK